MCEQETALRAAVAAGTLAENAALALHAEQCEDCALAALDAALSRVGFGPASAHLEDTDEFRLSMAVVGLDTPAERRAVQRFAAREPGDTFLRQALLDPNSITEEETMGERTEHSVLISLDTLERTPLGPRATGRSRDADASGLIDLSSLGLDSVASAPGTGFSRAAGPAPAPMRVLAMPTRRRRFAAMLPVAAGLFVALAAAGGAWFTLKSQDAAELSGPAGGPAGVLLAAASPAGPAVVAVGETPAAQASEARAIAPAIAPASMAANAAPTQPSIAGEARAAAASAARQPRAAGIRPAVKALAEPAAPAAPAEPARAAVAAPPRPAARANTDDVDDILGSLDGRGAKPAGGGAARPAGDDPLIPEQLTKPQILGVVKKAASGVATCRERQPSASGTVMVSLQIDRAGRVSKAAAKAPFAGTPVGNCVEGVVRTMRFPQFSGDPMTINMPFAL